MKRILALLLALTMVLGLSACGGGKTTESAAPQSTAPESTARGFLLHRPFSPA